MNIIWSGFLPWVAVHMEVLPPIVPRAGDDPAELASRAQRAVADALGVGVCSHTHFAKDVFMQAVGVCEVDARAWAKLRKDVQTERADILRRQTETQSRFAHPNKATVLALLKSSEGRLKSAVIEERVVSNVPRMQT